jgi:hypothetical protein
MTNSFLNWLPIVCALGAIAYILVWHLCIQLSLILCYLMFDYMFYGHSCILYGYIYSESQDGEDVTHVQSDIVGGLRHCVNNPVGLS